MLISLFFIIGSNEEVILPEPVRPVRDVIIEEVTTVEDGLVKVTPTGYVTVVKDGDSTPKWKINKKKKKTKRLHSKPKKLKSESKT